MVFFEVNGKPAIKDGATQSWYNLETAAFIINIIEDAVVNSEFPPSIFGIVTTYQAQAMVLRQAIRGLHNKYPSIQFDSAVIDTADSFQGGQNRCVFFCPVVTDRLGFVNDDSRMTVALSRHKDFFCVVGTSLTLETRRHGTNNLRKAYDLGRADKLVAKIEGNHPHLRNKFVCW
jgi:hypothetical protein